MSKELQELVQGDAGTEGGEEIKPMPTDLNQAKEEPAPEAEPSNPHFPKL